MNKSGIIVIRPLKQRLNKLVKDIESNFQCESKQISRNHYILFNDEVYFEVGPKYMTYIIYEGEQERKIIELNKFIDMFFEGEQLGLHYYDREEHYLKSQLVEYVFV